MFFFFGGGLQYNESISIVICTLFFVVVTPPTYPGPDVKTPYTFEPSICVQVDSYIAKAATIEPEPQFLEFRGIVNMYIMPGSELEVNIETAMRNKILKVRRSVYLHLYFDLVCFFFV